MKYVCELCGLTSQNIEKIAACEAQENKIRYAVGQLIVFLYDPRGVRWEVRGKIETVVYKLRTHNVSYRVLVGEDSRFRKQNQNCIYAGILDRHILRLA